MAFPRGRAEDAEQTIMTLAQEQIRKIMEVTRLLTLMVDDLSNSKNESEISAKYAGILRLDEDCKALKRSIEEHIMRAGSLLPEREDYIRLINGIDRISDKAEAAAFRLLSLNKIGASGEEVCRYICELSDSVLTIVEKLKEAILAIRINSSTLFHKLSEVEKHERLVDEVYRKVDMMLLQSKLSVPHLLLSREIIHLLEDIADKAEETVAILRALFPLAP